MVTTDGKAGKSATVSHKTSAGTGTSTVSEYVAAERQQYDNIEGMLLLLLLVVSLLFVVVCCCTGVVRARQLCFEKKPWLFLPAFAKATLAFFLFLLLLLDFRWDF